MKEVQERPLLPQAVPENLRGIAIAYGTLLRSLLAIFGEVGYRLNRVLPKDGSEAMSMPLTGGYFAEQSPTPRIHRMADRLFLGGAVLNAGREDGIGDADWLSADVDKWPMVNAQFGVQHTEGRMAIMGASRSSDGAVANATIGVGGFVVNDQAGASAWGLYSDIQHESGANWSAGWEVAAKNKGADLSQTPNSATGGVFGLWLAGGGDNSYGGVAANPSNAAMVVLKNAHTWNRGIVFMKDGLTAGEAMSLSSEGTGGSHSLTWYNAVGNKVFDIIADTSATDRWKLLRDAGGVHFTLGGVIAASFGGVSSGANYIRLGGTAAGTHPTINAGGSDTDIDIHLVPKGSGVMKFGTHTGIGAETVTGFITIRDTGGATRKLAVVS